MDQARPLQRKAEGEQADGLFLFHLRRKVGKHYSTPSQFLLLDSTLPQFFLQDASRVNGHLGRHIIVAGSVIFIF